MQTHWGKIEAKNKANLGVFGTVLGIMLRGLVSKAHLLEIRNFFDGKDTSKYERDLKRMLDSMEADIAWVERDRDDIKNWLRDGGFYDE